MTALYSFSFRKGDEEPILHSKAGELQEILDLIARWSAFFGHPDDISYLITPYRP